MPTGHVPDTPGLYAPGGICYTEHMTHTEHHKTEDSIYAYSFSANRGKTFQLVADGYSVDDVVKMIARILADQKTAVLDDSKMDRLDIRNSLTASVWRFSTDCFNCSIGHIIGVLTDREII